jgi:hypothetical protein
VYTRVPGLAVAHAEEGECAEQRYKWAIVQPLCV